MSARFPVLNPIGTIALPPVSGGMYNPAQIQVVFSGVTTAAFPTACAIATPVTSINVQAFSTPASIITIDRSPFYPAVNCRWDSGSLSFGGGIPGTTTTFTVYSDLTCTVPSSGNPQTRQHTWAFLISSIGAQLLIMDVTRRVSWFNGTVPFDICASCGDPWTIVIANENIVPGGGTVGYGGIATITSL